ncbi:lipocalin family protein [Salinibius halmophilus]|uniref:lipocalin family protein n=1 Tax=Salinibius halmophilus TaxID=1853216 RepID=UPI00389AD133
MNELRATDYLKTGFSTGSLFVLSRTPQMDEALYQSLLAQLEEKQIDTSNLTRTLQPEF